MAAKRNCRAKKSAIGKIIIGPPPGITTSAYGGSNELRREAVRLAAQSELLWGVRSLELK